MKDFHRLHCCFFLLLISSVISAQDFNLELRSNLAFPDETTRGVWGYAQNGMEYALVAADSGMIIVDVTNPDTPLYITEIIPDTTLNFYFGAQEIKTYGHYAYAAGDGLLIVDLSGLPGSDLAWKYYSGDGAILGQIKYIHTLHIDEKKGFLYANWVDNVAAVVILDLNVDPFNPMYAGEVNFLFMHDCYVENDTMYGAAINPGVVSVIDVSDKSNPVLLGTTPTPGGLTHNTWLLGNHQYVLTTDESYPSFLTAFDVSDPADIKEVGRVSSNNGYGARTHNTQVLNDWAITGWYRDGVVIVDAHRPENLVVTGRFDTWPSNIGYPTSLTGCWGVYSYLPSGNIVASNFGNEGELFVITPEYRRACYLEGTITDDSTGFPIHGVTVEIIGNTYSSRTTGINGIYKTGQPEEGTVLVSIKKEGYCPDTLTTNLFAGQVTVLDGSLTRCLPFIFSGKVIDEPTSAPAPAARVLLRSQYKTYETTADSLGLFSIQEVQHGMYDIYYGAWGWDMDSIKGQYLQPAVDEIVLPLKNKIYYDDFFFDFSWKTSGSINNKGKWLLTDPKEFFLDSLWNYIPGASPSNTIYIAPGDDVGFDVNDRCYVTGNEGSPSPWSSDADSTVTLTSPPMHLANYQDAVLSFWYWFFDDGPNIDADNLLEVWAINGIDTVTVFSEVETASLWRFSGDVHLKDYITLSDDVRIQFIVTIDDFSPCTKALTDAIKVVPSGLISNTEVTSETPVLKAYPNPSSDDFTLQYHWPGAQNLVLEIRNALGQVKISQTLPAGKGSFVCGEDWSEGIYFAVLRSEGSNIKTVKMIRQ